MKEIMIKNAEGMQLNVKVIRFFRLNGMEYLIFSLNEVDEGGYAKLYISKIVDNTGKLIEDDVEWNLIKDAIKNIIKANKDNLPLPIKDLSVEKLVNLQITDQKIFKLNDSLLQLLMDNVQEEITAQPITEINEFAEIAPTNIEPANEFPEVVPTTMESVNEFASVGVQNNFSISEEINSSNVEVSTTNEQITNSEYALDYKVLYENELKKNEELINEVTKYREQLNNIKAIIED